MVLCIVLMTIRRRSSVQGVKGMRDVWGDEAVKHRFMHESFRSVALLYGFQEISTPLVEHAELFQHTLGADTDVVSKEMYSFPDKNNTLLALRPEGTAGVMRAYLHSTLRDSAHSVVPANLFYSGPMFRYERPQAGRYRQFSQLGIESIGNSSPSTDVNTIAMAVHLLQTWGILEHTTLEINTLGDAESREKHREVLKSYFESFRKALSPLSRHRLERGSILRILDSKEKEDQYLIHNAPSIMTYLTPAAKQRWKLVLRGLADLGISYVHNEQLVRGLDYYTHTCFEFTTEKLGAHSAILAGGRYDGLAEKLGGLQPAPGIGWALGLERASLLVDDAHEELVAARAALRSVAIIAISEGTSDEARAANAELRNLAINLTQQLRANNIRAVFVDSEELTGNQNSRGDAIVSSLSLRRQLTACDKHNCFAAIFLGIVRVTGVRSKEVAEEKVTVKTLDSGEQVTLPITIDAILDHIKHVVDQAAAESPSDDRMILVEQ